MIFSPDGLMRYNNSLAVVDDIPLLSQWIRKGAVKKQPEKKNYKSIEKDRLVVIFVVKFN